MCSVACASFRIHDRNYVASCAAEQGNDRHFMPLLLLLLPLLLRQPRLHYQTGDYHEPLAACRMKVVVLIPIRSLELDAQVGAPAAFASGFHGPGQHDALSRAFRIFEPCVYVGVMCPVIGSMTIIIWEMSLRAGS